MQITEDLIYFIWKFKYFQGSQLKTTDGASIQILQPGVRNIHSGPDFSNARIRLGTELWAGNVEIHVMSSEWNQHGHQKDPAYNNVILHVVWSEDEKAMNQSGAIVPSLVLKDKVDISLLSQYDYLMNSQKWIPCADPLAKITDITKANWIQRLMAERLERKATDILTSLKLNQNDWESVCYQKLARSFGSQVNGEAMEMLARITPLSVLYKHRDQLWQIESLLFGQSGLLEDSGLQDEYPVKLKNEYDFLKDKYHLTPMKKDQWKFLRMRPANFPTIHIAQLARILYQSDHVFSRLIAAKNVREIVHMIDIRISNFWKDHYSFNPSDASKEKSLGKQTAQNIVINTICPLLFSYGISTDQEQYKEKALNLLSEMPAENNFITRGWNYLGWKAMNGMDSQALIQLKNEYCDHKRCLGCSIGHQIIRNT